jgi:hypothetical protein
MALTGHIVVGVFADPAQTDDAVQALLKAGFLTDHIYSSGYSSSGSFSADIKRFFGDSSTTTGNVVYDLTGSGLSDNEIQDYDSEYHAGRGIVAVLAEGRERDVQDILLAAGATRSSLHRAIGDNMQNATSGDQFAAPANDAQTVAPKEPFNTATATQDIDSWGRKKEPERAMKRYKVTIRHNAAPDKMHQE